MQLSVNGGTGWDTLTHTQGWMQGSGYHYQTPTRTINFAVNNTSDYKMKFYVIFPATGIITTGSSNRQHTGFCISKIADL